MFFNLQRIKTLFYLLAFLMLTACQGVHLYNQPKDTLATGIKEAYDSMDVKNVLETHKSNMKKLAEAERGVAADSLMFIRDAVIWQLANGLRTGDFEESDKTGDKSLKAQILPNFDDDCVVNRGKPCESYATRRLIDLGITSNDVLKGVVDELTKTVGGVIDEPGASLILSERVDDGRIALEELGWKNVWDCEKAVEQESTSDRAAKEAEIPEGDRFKFDPVFNQYKSLCEAFGKNQTYDFTGVKEGIIGETYEKWKADQDLVNQIQAAREAAKVELENLKPKAAEGTETENGETFVQKSQESAKNIANIIKNSNKAVKTLGLEEVFAKARLDDLGFLLNVVHAGSLEGLSDDDIKDLEGDPAFHRAAVLAAGLPGLGNKVEAVIDLLGRPEARTDLLILYAYQKARVDYLKRLSSLYTNRAQMQEKLLRSMLREASLLYRAKQFVEGPPDISEKKLAEVLDGRDKEAKANLYEALIAFDHAISVARKNGEEIRSDLLNFGVNEKLLADEYAIDTWNALLKGPIDQLAAYYKAGIKPESVAEAIAGIMSLGFLGAIAVGVN